MSKPQHHRDAVIEMVEMLSNINISTITEQGCICPDLMRILDSFEDEGMDHCE